MVFCVSIKQRITLEIVINSLFGRIFYFLWHKFVSAETESFEQITGNRVDLQFAVGIFEIPFNRVATAFQIS